jgi:hypothetical protein
MDDFRRDLSLLNARYESGRKLRKAGASSRAATAPKPGKGSAFSGY